MLRARSMASAGWSLSTQNTTAPSIAACRTDWAAGSSSGLLTGISSRLVPVRSTSAETPARKPTANGSENAYDSRSVNSTPIEPARPLRSVRAAASGPVYPSSSATAKIRSRSASESWPGLLYALETVDGDTPTAWAIVLMVTAGAIVGLLSATFF